MFRPVQQLSSARSRGNGPHIVVLKDNITQECLMVIYDNKPTAKSYSIEGTNQCRKGSLPKISLRLPMEVESDDSLPDLKRLKFHVPREYLLDLPDFFVNTATIREDSIFELDPPQDVYGKLTLVSPEKASLVLTFRPPASHPKLINSFTFEFSNQNEKIIYQIRNDGVNTSIDEPHIKTMSHLIHVQGNPNTVLEIYPRNNFTYPGNHTVTLITLEEQHLIQLLADQLQSLPLHDSSQNSSRHEGLRDEYKGMRTFMDVNFKTKRYKSNLEKNIEEKKFLLQDGNLHNSLSTSVITLAPKDSRINVCGQSAELSWGEPHLFGSSCKYRALAKPTGGKGFVLSAFASANNRRVEFHSLSPATEYEFTLMTNCSTGKSIITVLGTRKTGPREPGIVRNLKIRLIKVGVVELSWDPPEFMEGDSHIYNFSCKHNHEDDPHSGKTPNTTLTIENVAAGMFSCVVSTTSSVNGHKAKKGHDSNAVSIYVPSDRADVDGQ
ncbi:hypothetical protein ACTXT7_013761 [Hymenolepis weldensis]